MAYLSVATEACDRFFGRIEQVTLIGREAGQVNMAGAIGTKARATGLAGQIQRLCAYPPDGGLGPGLDERQALSPGLEDAQIAVAFERAAVDGQKAVTSCTVTPASASGMHMVSRVDSVE